jgi:hypothetical protein
MVLIGMAKAGELLGVGPNSARRALQNADVPLVQISSRCYLVEDSDAEAYVKVRGKSPKKGRPPGAKNKEKPTAEEK